MSVNLLKDLGYDEGSSKVKNARAAASMYADVIDHLVECREKADLSQNQVAKLMRTSQSTVSEFESASADARFSTLIRYAKAVDCEMVIEITRPDVKPSHEWVHISVKDEAELIPFPETRGQVHDVAGFLRRERVGNPKFSNYKLAGVR